MWTRILSLVRRIHYLPSYFSIHLETCGRRGFRCLSKNADCKSNNLVENPFHQIFHSSSISILATKRVFKTITWLQIKWIQNSSCLNRSYTVFPSFHSLSVVYGKKGVCSMNKNIIVPSNILLSTSLYGMPLYRTFHSSSVRHTSIPPIPPILWKVIMTKLFSLILAVITGRTLRIWWRNLPPNKKQSFIKTARESQWKIAGLASLTSGMIIVYYYSHIEETPYTKRKRFMAFTPEQFRQISDFAFQLQFQANRNYLLSSDHPSYKRVENVVNRLLNANSHIKELSRKKWAISVVDKSDVKNASILPNGQIFIFTGMLKVCSNDDQLGLILAHEVAHSILEHGAENLSYSQFLDAAFIVMVAAIWAIMPTDFISLIAHLLFNKIVDISFQLPYSRMLELEADEIGLQLAAKACFDLRESSAFWAKIDVFDGRPLLNFEWLSTHPSNKRRMKHLESIMDKNIELRKSYGCPPLSDVDPRKNIYLFKKSVKQMLNQHDTEKLKDKNLVVINVPTN